MKSESWDRLVELRERFQEIDRQLDELTQDSQRLPSDMTKEEREELDSLEREYSRLFREIMRSSGNG